MGLYIGPLGIGEVGLVCSSHARYSTELLPPDTFSDSFLREFSEVAGARDRFRLMPRPPTISVLSSVACPVRFYENSPVVFRACLRMLKSNRSDPGTEDSREPMYKIPSKDGTAIAFDRAGQGPPSFWWLARSTTGRRMRLWPRPSKIASASSPTTAGGAATAATRLLTR